MIGNVDPEFLPSNADETFVPAPAPADRRRVWPFVAGGIGAAFVALAVAGYVFVAPYLMPSGFRAAQYFPRDTWFFGTVTARPGISQSLAAKNLTDAFTTQPGFEDAIRALEANTPSGANSELDKEMWPLLDGEVAFGGFGSLNKPDVVVMFHSNDPEKLLHVMAASEKAPEPRERYHDALYFESAHTMGAATHGWVIYGLTRNVVEQAVDRIENGSTDGLASSERYQSVIQRLPSEKVGFMYFDSQPFMATPQVDQALRQAGPAFQSYLAPLTGRAAVSLTAANDGLDLRWESIPDQAAQPTISFSHGSSITAFEQLPTDTLFAVGGDSLPALLSGVDDAINAVAKSSPMGAMLPRLQFSSWLGGEFAAGVTRGTLTADGRGTTSGNPDLFLVARVKDSKAASDELNGFDLLLRPKPTTIQGVPMKQLGASPASSAYYGVGGEWMYLLYGEPDKFLGQRSAVSGGLTESASYQRVRRAVSTDGLAVFVDLENGRRTIEDLLPPSARAEYDKSRVLLQPIRALGGSLRTGLNGDTHGQLLLAISK